MNSLGRSLREQHIWLFFFMSMPYVSVVVPSILLYPARFADVVTWYRMVLFYKELYQSGDISVMGVVFTIICILFLFNISHIFVSVKDICRNNR